MGDNRYSDIMGIGSYGINMRESNVLLTDVMYVSTMKMNLVFIFTLTGKNFEIYFELSKVTMIKHDRIIFEGKFVKEHVMFKVNKRNNSFCIYILCFIYRCEYMA